jgi:hypothetical protein
MMSAIIWDILLIVLWPQAYLELDTGSANANKREPKSCLDRVFNFKLGHFVMYPIAQHIQARRV